MSRGQCLHIVLKFIKQVSSSIEDAQLRLTYHLMESYSIAKFCYINKIKFICYKYITDNADENSPENWNLNIEKGAELFIKTLNDLI